MANLEKQMFNIINRNHDCKMLADKLNAISARRKRRGKKVMPPRSWNLRNGTKKNNHI